MSSIENSLVLDVDLMIFNPFLETDLIPGLAAFVACLVLPLELGILIGIGINVVFIMYHAARPKISIEQYSVRSDLQREVHEFLF